jgi:predicted SAM-dependent methyltransferase
MIRLNLGSGKHPWPNATNCDVDPRANIQTTVDRLDAFNDNEVDEIYAIHLFEHLPRLELARFITEWKRVLKVGGRLIIEVPCLDKIAQMIVSGEDRVGLTLFGIFGDIREPSPYMRHQWCYTAKELSEILTGGGFDVQVTDPVYHVRARDMRVIAIKKGVNE